MCEQDGEARHGLGPMQRTLLAAGAAIAIGLVIAAALGGYLLGLNQPPPGSTCGETFEAAQTGFQHTEHLIVLFKTRTALAQQMVDAVHVRDEVLVTRLRALIASVDSQMESTAADIGTAETLMYRRSLGCAW